MTGPKDQPKPGPPFASGGSILPAHLFPAGGPIPLQGEFKEVLGKAMGLKPELVQDGALRNALSAFGQRYGGDATHWLARMRGDAEALNYFCGQLTVGETWFFRDWTPFACLKQFVEEQVGRSHFQSPLRILSLPCSTGEEPWSMAMILAQLGFQAGQAVIDAVDINTTSLDALNARKYLSYSRREANPEANALLDRFTRPTAHGFEIDKSLTVFVQTHHGNILDSQLAPAGRGVRYHAIFSRNLFIYLDAASKKKAAKNLLKLLHPDGILYLGHTEGRVLDSLDVELWKEAYLFAFTPRKKSPPSLPAIAPLTASTSTPAIAPIPRAAGVKPPVKRAAPAGPRSKSGIRSRRLSALGSPEYQKALDAANRGDLQLATQLCANLVVKEPAKAQNWCLAGTIEQAKGKTQEALGMFDRALYLDPRHVQALQISALLRRQLGQTALAEQLERRLALAQKGKKEP